MLTTAEVEIMQQTRVRARQRVPGCSRPRSLLPVSGASAGTGSSLSSAEASPLSVATACTGSS